MKKVILSLAIVAAMFVSCKETAAENTEAVDSTAVEAPAVEEAPADSTAVAADSDGATGGIVANLVNQIVKNNENYFDYPISLEAIKKLPLNIKNRVFAELKQKKVSNLISNNFKDQVKAQVGDTLQNLFFEGLLQ